MANFYTYRKAGFSTFSNTLFEYYSYLNISETELVLIVQLEVFGQQEKYFPSNEELAKVTNLSAIEISELLQGLINKELIELEQINDKDGRISNFYSLQPLYEKIDRLFSQRQLSNKSSSSMSPSQPTSLPSEDDVQMTVRQFEIEFGRLLSPIERQEIAAWINEDHYDPQVIKLALREAILAQVYNFKYIDRILLNWQRHHLNTVEKVKNYLQRNV